MKKRDAVMGGFWTVLGLVISIWSVTFPFGSREAPGPAFFPLALGVILVILGSLLFFHTVTQKDERSVRRLAPIIPERRALKRIVLAGGGMLLSAAALEHLGFIVTMFFLIFFMMRAIDSQKWKVAVLYAFISALGSAWIFQVLLKTPLPRGFLGF